MIMLPNLNLVFVLGNALARTVEDVFVLVAITFIVVQPGVGATDAEMY